MKSHEVEFLKTRITHIKGLLSQIESFVLENKEIPIDIDGPEIFCSKGDNSDNVNFFQSLINRYNGKKVTSEDGKFGPMTDKHTAAMFKSLGIEGYDGDVRNADVQFIFGKIKNSDPSPDNLYEVYSKVKHIQLLEKYVQLGWKEGVGSKAWAMFQKEWANAGYSMTNWAWCSTGQHEVLDQAGLNLPYYIDNRTFAVVGNFEYWGREKDYWHEDKDKIQPGDLFVTSGKKHIGAVLHRDGDYIVTSEGNSRDMYRSRKYKISSCRGFIQIPDGATFYTLKG